MKCFSSNRQLIRDSQPPVLLTLLIALFAISGCSPAKVAPPGTGASSQPPKLKVVATVLPMYLFTKAVAGEVADVRMLVPPGTEIHEYQSTPADVQTIAKANVLVKNGLGLEEFLDNTVDSAQNSKLIEVNASQKVEPLGEISPVFRPGDAAADAKQAQNHGRQGNPHVWLDPVLAKQQVEIIRDGLTSADPAHKTTYQANAAAYIQQLEELDNQFEQRLNRYHNRTFITFHDAFPYLAKRYRLKQVAVVAIPEDTLSPTEIQQIVTVVKRYKVKAVFGETGGDNKLLQNLSSDLNVTLGSLDSLESGSQDPQYYFTVMKTNLHTLDTAFH